jgi:hypothetical protein
MFIVKDTPQRMVSPIRSIPVPRGLLWSGTGRYEILNLWNAEKWNGEEVDLLFEIYFSGLYGIGN